ncbi:MAG: phosphopentomutase [Candidatus Caenarcaniphilales bacterium]|nr:phosphopentomutase [Candidatus Caenarcaniphilales bacterium]
MSGFKRVFLVVLDACGIGAMPDWERFDDPKGANTLKHVAEHCNGLNLPNLQKLGLGNIDEIKGVSRVEKPLALWGKAAEKSYGKDTTTGHWEMAGLVVEQPFPIYPNGFPSGIINEFVNKTKCGGVLCNEPASGTEVIDRLGDKHLETGWPIVYTSADSVFQIATHSEKVSVEKLYEWCEIAREMLRGKHEVSRVIARPFAGEPGSFYRLSEKRHDYAIEPRGETILSFLSKNNCETISIGKINDIFCGVGIDKVCEGKSNEVCMQNIEEIIKTNPSKDQFIFANLVETDSHFGHRNNAVGFGEALEKIDAEIGKWIDLLKNDDLLILTADHGCDPTLEGTDHTREYVPILAFSPSFEEKVSESLSIGTRESFADVASSVLKWFDFDNEFTNTKSTSFV